MVLLNIMMSGIDGFEICRELKEDEQPASISIIFINVLQENIDKIKIFSLRRVDYITKSFNAEEVLAWLKTHLAFFYNS